MLPVGVNTFDMRATIGIKGSVREDSWTVTSWEEDNREDTSESLIGVDNARIVSERKEQTQEGQKSDILLQY